MFSILKSSTYFLEMFYYYMVFLLIVVSSTFFVLAGCLLLVSSVSGQLNSATLLRALSSYTFRYFIRPYEFNNTDSGTCAVVSEKPGMQQKPPTSNDAAKAPEYATCDQFLCSRSPLFRDRAQMLAAKVPYFAT